MKMNSMHSRKKMMTACACLAVLAMSGCSKDSDKDGNKDGPTNTADEATFKEAGSKFMDMLGQSKRASVGTNPQRRPSGRMAFAQIADFANVEATDDGSPDDSGDNGAADDKNDQSSSIVSSACPEFVVGGMPETEQTNSESKSDGTSTDGFSITRGESCADALKEMNAKYSQVLNDLEGQINALVNLDPAKLRSQCGLNAEKANVDKSKAAIAWRLTPSQTLGQGNSAAIEVFGGANGAVVTLGSSFEGKMDLSALNPGMSPNPNSDSDIEPDDGSGSGSGSEWPRDSQQQQTSMGSMEFSGSNATSGDLVARTLTSKTRAGFTMKMGAMGGEGGAQGSAMSTIFDSQTNVSGLAEGQRLKVGESVSFDINMDGGQAGQPKQSMSGTFNLTVEEVKTDELKVTGSYDAGAGQKGQFELTMAKDRYGVCQVVSVSQTGAK